MHRKILQSFLSECHESGLEYHEAELLLVFGCLLGLKGAAPRHRALDREFGADTSARSKAFCQALEQHVPELWKLLEPHLPFSPDAREELAIWAAAFYYYDRLEYAHDLERPEQRAQVFEETLYALADQSALLGEYTSPRDIVRVTSLLARREAGEKTELSVLDPACGTGGFLTGAVQMLPGAQLQVSGAAGERKIADLCAMGLFLTGGKGAAEIRSGGPAYRAGAYDLVLSRIPFGRRQEHVYLEELFQSAAPGGSVIAIVPNGVLFRQGKDAALRKSWLENNRLDMIVYLPENLLYAKRIPSSIVVLKTERPANAPVRLVDLEHGSIVGRKRNRLGETQLETVRRAIFDDAPDDARILLVSAERLQEDGCNLSRDRFFSEADAEDADAPAPSLARIRTLEAELEKTRRELEEYYRRCDAGAAPSGASAADPG